MTATVYMSAELQGVLDTVPASISLWDRELRALHLNRVCVEWNPPAQPPPWIGKSLHVLYPHVTRNGLREYERALRGERFNVFRNRRELGLGTGPTFVSVSYGPILEQGKIVGFSVVSVDASQTVVHEEALTRANELLERRQQELETAVAARDEFLGLVSHEMRTPLAIMQANTQLLERAALNGDSERVLQIQAALEENGERLARTIDNMLALARIEAGALEEPEPALVSRLAEQVLTRYRRWQPGRVLTVRGSGSETPVLSHPDHIIQVIDNLVTNALKYTSGPVEVEVLQTAAAITVHVRDEGDGISPDLATRLFEPFARGSRPGAGGLGLGLNVCKRLVEAHGGKVWAENRNSGGADFAFSLPAAPIPFA
jgi:signal transduction histidine kinase